jgi:O-succinylbenzoate synthase
MVKMTFVTAEGITVSTNNSMRADDLILTDSNQEIAAFIVKPSNKSSVANLDKLVFNVADYVGSLPTNANADEYFEVRL